MLDVSWQTKSPYMKWLQLFTEHKFEYFSFHKEGYFFFLLMSYSSL